MTWIIVSNGFDSYDGSGPGTDILDLRGFASGVTFNLATGVSNNARLDGDLLVGIDRIDGSKFGDHLTGDAATNTLNGRGGNDNLAGGGNADLLQGGWVTTLFTGAAAKIPLSAATARICSMAAGA